MEPLVITWDGIVFAGAVVTALGGIFGVLCKMLRIVLADRDDVRYCQMWTLRQAIFNEDFPVEDRIEAFERYEAKGGNGYTRQYVEQVLVPRLAKKVHNDVEGD